MATSNILELDFNDKLQITINNTKPVVLTDLTMALLGVGQQFERFIENETTEQANSSLKRFDQVQSLLSLSRKQFQLFRFFGKAAPSSNGSATLSR